MTRTGRTIGSRREQASGHPMEPMPMRSNSAGAAGAPRVGRQSRRVSNPAGRDTRLAYRVTCPRTSPCGFAAVWMLK